MAGLPYLLILVYLLKTISTALFAYRHGAVVGPRWQVVCMWAATVCFALCLAAMVRRRREGIWPAALGCLLHLAAGPWSIFGVASEAWGIYHFWSLRGKAGRPEPETKPDSSPWDGWIQLASWVLTFYLSAKLRWFAIGLGFRDEELALPGVSFVILILFATACHEAGHLLGAWICRFRVVQLKVGPILWESIAGRSKLRLVWNGVLGGGHVAAIPSTLVGLRLNWLIICMAGPAGSFVLGLIGAILLLTTAGTPLEAGGKYWLTFATWGLLDGFLNLLPVGRSDGAQIWHVSRNTARGQEILRTVAFLGERENISQSGGDCDYVAKLALVEKQLREAATEGIETEVFLQDLQTTYLAKCRRDREAMERMEGIAREKLAPAQVARLAGVELSLGNFARSAELWDLATQRYEQQTGGKTQRWDVALPMAEEAVALRDTAQARRYLTHAPGAPPFATFAARTIEARVEWLEGNLKGPKRILREAILARPFPGIAGKEDAAVAEDHCMAALYQIEFGDIADGYRSATMAIDRLQQLQHLESADWQRLKLAAACLPLGRLEEAKANLEAISCPPCFPFTLLLAHAELQLRTGNALGALAFLDQSKNWLDNANREDTAKWYSLRALAQLSSGQNDAAIQTARSRPSRLEPQEPAGATEAIYVEAILAGNDSDALPLVRSIDAILTDPEGICASGVLQLQQLSTRLARSQYRRLAYPLLASAQRLWDRMEPSFARPEWAPAADPFEESLCQLGLRIGEQEGIRNQVAIPGF